MTGDGLAAFITARLDEMQAAAERAASVVGPRWQHDTGYTQFDRPYSMVRSAVSAAIVADVLRGPDDKETGPFIAANDPACVLRQVAAFRSVVAEHETRTEGGGHDGQARCRVCTAIANGHVKRFTAPCPTLRFLAAIWKDHPDYRQEWAP